MGEMKPTPGPWEAHGNLVRSSMAPPPGVPRGVQIAECRDSYFLPHSEEAKDNARLIAEAGTVFHNTGLSPVQLVEQRDGLASLLREIYDMARQGALPNDGDEWFELTRAALAKCEGVK